MGKKKTIERIREILSVWWLTYPSEKYEFVSWDDDIPNLYGKIKSNVPNHQPVVYDCLSCREINMKRGAVPTEHMYSVLVCGTTEFWLALQKWWMISGCHTI